MHFGAAWERIAAVARFSSWQSLRDVLEAISLLRARSADQKEAARKGKQFVERYVLQFVLDDVNSLNQQMLQLFASMLAEPDVDLALPERIGEPAGLLRDSSAAFKIEVARKLLVARQNQRGERDEADVSVELANMLMAAERATGFQDALWPQFSSQPLKMKRSLRALSTTVIK